MAASDKGVEKRPSSRSADDNAETRVVGDLNTDEETRVKPGDLADGVDKDTRDLVVHDTTTRERTVNAKRAHEPLDLDAADDKQPDEGGNGPRAKEVEPGTGPSEETSSVSVSESQVEAGAKVRDGRSSE
jgi:hypothetical protein